MNAHSLALLTAALITTPLWIEPGLESDAAEPTGPHVLSIDGQEYELVVGEEQTIRLGETEHRVLLRAPRYRLFDKVGLRFEYDYAMAYEYDDSTPGAWFWTFDGNDAVVMVHRYQFLEADQLSNVLLEGIRAQFEDMSGTSEVEPVRLEGQGFELDGDRLTVRLGEIYLTQELYCWQGPKGGMALILQDTRDRPRQPSEEFRALRAHVAETLVLAD